MNEKIDLERLKALALELNGVRWNEPQEQHSDTGWRYQEITTEAGDVVIGECGLNEAEARFVAAASPAVVLGLIARIGHLNEALKVANDYLAGRPAGPAVGDALVASKKPTEIKLPGYVSLRYEARTTGEPGWLLYDPSNRLVRAMNLAETELIESSLHAHAGALVAKADYSCTLTMPSEPGEYSVTMAEGGPVIEKMWSGPLDLTAEPPQAVTDALDALHAVGLGLHPAENAAAPADIKKAIVHVLDKYTTEMEGYSYFGSNPGVKEDDYEEIADEVIALLATNLPTPTKGNGQ